VVAAVAPSPSAPAIIERRVWVAVGMVLFPHESNG